MVSRKSIRQVIKQVDYEIALSSLSDEDLQILLLIDYGLSFKEISCIIKKHPRTIQRHMDEVLYHLCYYVQWYSQHAQAMFKTPTPRLLQSVSKSLHFRSSKMRQVEQQTNNLLLTYVCAQII